MKKKSLEKLFIITDEGYIYKSMTSDGFVVEQVGKAVFSQKGNMISFNKIGEKPYSQTYHDEQQAQYQLRSWIRSYKRGEFE